MNQRTLQRIDAALEGRLDEEEFRELQLEMLSDPAALDHWCGQAEIHGRLEWELGAGAAELPVREPAWRPGPRWLRLAAAAALLVAGIGIGLVIPRAGRSPAALTDAPAPAVRAIARLTGNVDARWVGKGPDLGGGIGEGALELASGTAMITFDSGATVQLRGPAKLHLTSPVRTVLERGCATVEIPRQAFGFVFETPTSEISHRLSRFVVVVEESGGTEIHVLAGEIRMVGKSGDLEPLKLAKDRAVRMGGGGITEAVRYQASDLATSLPESADLLPEWYLHWSFDALDRTTGVFRETGAHEAIAPPFPAQVHLPDAESSVSVVAGKFGSAVKLNGQRGFLATDFPGISGRGPRSVSFWVRIPPDTPDALAYSILSWGTKNTAGGGKWQLGWNTGSDNSGAIGAIRTEVERGYIIGSTDLRNGQWHHVVSVFSGGDRPDVAADVRHYVDGRLEATTAAKSREVNTLATGAQALPVTLGRRVEGDYQNYRTFGGEMDEVYLFPSALTPEQIESLYRDNRPPALRR